MRSRPNPWTHDRTVQVALDYGFMAIKSKPGFGRNGPAIVNIGCSMAIDATFFYHRHEVLLEIYGLVWSGHGSRRGKKR